MQVSTATQVICDRDTWKGQRVLNERKIDGRYGVLGKRAKIGREEKYNPKPHLMVQQNEALNYSPVQIHGIAVRCSLQRGRKHTLHCSKHRHPNVPYPHRLCNQ